MLSPDIVSKIKQIKIRTQRIASSILAGSKSSAQKGSGFEFDQIREYQFGDNIKFIDWNSSARTGKLLVRQYIEERDRTIVLVVDGSASGFCGSGVNAKYDFIAQIASVLALIAQYGSDRVALVLFSDSVKKVILPSNSMHHVQYIMEQLFAHSCTGKTDLAQALVSVMRLHVKNALVFIISDFIASNFERELKMLSYKHEVVAIRCVDTGDLKLPVAGSLLCQDPETGDMEEITITSWVNQFLYHRIAEQNKLFAQQGICYLDVSLERPFIGDLISFLCRQMKY